MIAQDPKTHPGSIVRIKTDGSVPNDNPHFTSHPDWLPEIYSIGVRNSQGITLTPENDVLFSSHGPRGGDHIAIAQPGANFGWKHISWGGSEYTGIKIGKSPFDDQFTNETELGTTRWQLAVYNFIQDKLSLSGKVI